VHRCIGSNLARTQARIGVEQTIARLSPFRIPPGAPVEYVSSFSRGPASVPIEFAAGRPLDRTVAAQGAAAS
jgi:cytochrome P450